MDISFQEQEQELDLCGVTETKHTPQMGENWSQRHWVKVEPGGVFSFHKPAQC